jgi:hypothetical protein
MQKETVEALAKCVAEGHLTGDQLVDIMDRSSLPKSDVDIEKMFARLGALFKSL